MKLKKEPVPSAQKDTARLEFFSDGVFAIAITLLVLELIQIIHPKDGLGLLDSYLHHWQSFLAFLIGFVTLLVCWVNHHHVFHFIKRSDSGLPWINGFVLLMITFTPFPTAILAEYMEAEGEFALGMYGFNYFMIAVASYLLCWYSVRKSLVDESEKRIFHFVKITYKYSIIYTLMTFGICFISAPLAIFLYLLLFYFFAFPEKLAFRLQRIQESRRRQITKKH
jgi:uncharacterized membrane protein